MGALATIRSWLRPRPETKGFRIVPADGFISADTGSRWSRYGQVPETFLEANVVMSPVNWILRNFTEAEAKVERRVEGVWTVDEDHTLTQLLGRPNPFYGDSLLWKATVLSFCLDGNSYWQKVRNAIGDVLGYWYLPHHLVEPKWPQTGATFISHYEYRPATTGQPIPLAVDDVVHFRFGLDPMNPRKGLSPLKPLLREVFTDDEASIFASAILGNMGVPGGVIAPGSKDALPSAADVQQMKDYMSGFTGTRRGEWLVLGAPTDIKQFGFDPNNLQLGSLRDIAEERVCAALGVPAAVVGFGAGLQQTKVGATMRELRKEAWNSCIRPMQNDMAKQLTNQTIGDFVTQTRRFRVRFDTSSFAASQEEEKEKAERAVALVGAGILRVDRAQQMLGLEIDPTRAIYLGPGTGAPKVPEADPPESDDDSDPENRLKHLLSNGNGKGESHD